MIFQIIAILFTVVVCLIIIGHIKEAWYDLTHMDEYRERMAYKRELRQAKKDAEIEFNHNAMEKFRRTGRMF